MSLLAEVKALYKTDQADYEECQTNAYTTDSVYRA